jgi:putative transport protein
MKFELIAFLTNPFVPMFLAVVTGLLLGRIKIGKFSFGQSGALFTGIFIGWLLYSKYCVAFMLDPHDSKKGLITGAPKYAANYLANGVIPSSFFSTKTDEVAAGYGACYPFALLCKVIFVIILHKVT